jgi:hypothetical protein
MDGAALKMEEVDHDADVVDGAAPVADVAEAEMDEEIDELFEVVKETVDEVNADSDVA